jgi:uncharacterized protein YkwD/glutaredoxin
MIYFVKGLVLFHAIVLIATFQAKGQNQYSWTDNNITFGSSIKLTIESNDINAFIAWSKPMTVNLSRIGGMEGIDFLTGSLENYVDQFGYQNRTDAIDFKQDNKKLVGAYLWAEKRRDNILIALLSNANYTSHFFCEISYIEGLEDIAFNVLTSICFGTPAKTIQENFTPSSSDPKISENQPTESTVEQPKDEQDMIEQITILVNQLRAHGCQCGEKQMPPALPVVHNSILTMAAKAHSEDMDKRQYFAHDAPDPSPYGRSVSERVKYFNYPTQMIGENIAYNYTRTPESYFEQWKKSPGHCENMMTTDFKEIGYGVSGIYSTMVLGASTETQTVGKKPVAQPTTNSVVPIVYGRESCGLCIRAKDRLREEGINYIFYDVDKDADKNQEMWSLLRNTESVTFPVIKVNNEVFPNAMNSIDEIVGKCRLQGSTIPGAKPGTPKPVMPVEEIVVYDKVKVVLFGNPDCLNTINCIRKLKTQNIVFSFIDISQNEENENIMRNYLTKIDVNVPFQVPVVFAGKRRFNNAQRKVDGIVECFKKGVAIEIYGNNQNETAQLLNSLDAANVIYNFYNFDQDQSNWDEFEIRYDNTNWINYPAVVINDGEYIFNGGNNNSEEIIALIKQLHD